MSRFLSGARRMTPTISAGQASRGTRRERKRFRFRFSLRTLLLFVAVFGVALWAWQYFFVSMFRQPLRSTDWRLVCTLPTGSEITQLEFSPDGTTLATGHASGKVNLWDLPHGDLRLTLQLSGSVNSISFSPDGALVAGASDSIPTVYIWNVTSGEIHESLTHSDIVTSLDFSHNGKFLATFEGGSVVNIWHVASSRLEASFQSAPTSQPRLMVAPSGEDLARIR